MNCRYEDLQGGSDEMFRDKMRINPPELTLTPLYLQNNLRQTSIVMR